MANSKKLILIFIVIGLAFATVTQALLLTKMWDPPWNPYRPSPEQILMKSLQQYQNLNATNTNTLLQFDFTKNAQSRFLLETQVSSEIDTSTSKPRSQGTLTGKVEFEGAQIFYNAEYKVIDEKLYVRLITFPFLSYLQGFLGSGVDRLYNEWIEFDIRETLEEQGEEIPNDVTQKVKEKVQNLTQEKRLFGDIQQLQDETIRETSTYHIRLSIKQSALKELVALIVEQEEISNANQNTSPYVPYVAPAKGFDEIVNDFLTQVGDVPLDIWIEKSQFRPYRIAVQKQIPVATLAPELANQFDAIQAYFQIDFVEFETPVQVTAPENSSTLEEIFSLPYRYGNNLVGAQASARDARRQSDIRQISTAMELYYAYNNQYLPSARMPAVISDILPIVPTDPGRGICPSYQWIDNTLNSQSYCVYACLEDGGFFVASPRGAYELPVIPPSLAACES